MCCLGKLHLNLTGWEGLILHDNSAAAGQNHDVELLLLIVGLLVPLPHHIRVVGGNQSDLREGEILSNENSEPENAKTLKATKRTCILVSHWAFPSSRALRTALLGS